MQCGMFNWLGPPGEVEKKREGKGKGKGESEGLEKTRTYRESILDFVKFDRGTRKIRGETGQHKKEKRDTGKRRERLKNGHNTVGVTFLVFYEIERS